MREVNMGAATHRSRAATWAIWALAVAAGGCKTTDVPNDGPRCTEAFSACGGDVVGTWNLDAVCIVGDVSTLVDFEEPACGDVLQSVSVTPSATYTFSRATLVVTGNLAVDMTIRLTAECLQALSDDADVEADERTCGELQDQYNDPDSESIAGAECRVDGRACMCTLFSPQQTVATNAAYRLEDNSIISESGGVEPYCVQDERLTVTTQVMGLDATMILERNR